MPLDGIFLHHLTNELNMLVGARAEKIYQPTRDELVFLLRSIPFTGKLLISVRTGAARLHTTNSSFDNPAEPPNFCKLLRKHLTSAKITEINQVDFERIIIIKFTSYNEMGDVIHPCLVVELITGRENLVLLNEDGKILDALRRSDLETATRLLVPGAKYTLPESQNKLMVNTSSAEDLCDAVLSSVKPLGLAFTDKISGVSPLISRELASKVCNDIDIAPQDADKARLLRVILEFKENFSAPIPYIIKDADGGAVDFSFTEINQYGESRVSEKRDSFSALLDNFYAERENAHRIKTQSADINRLLTTAKTRAERRMAVRANDLERCKDRETLRIYGELLKANLYAVEKGASVARVQNYYDENFGFVDIPLDPAVSPAQNAAKYFKDYKKSHTAEQTLLGLIEKDKAEIEYIDSVLHSLSLATGAADLADIRDELAGSGYIIRKNTRKQKPKEAKPREFTSPTGFKIYVGKNNIENDYLTTKFASKQDIWFHTKNIPGSHVILVTEGKEVDDQSLLFAAGLAAAHSKASDSDKVPVDFTEIKYVKKPAGAKPGMVIYTTNKTIYVNGCCD
ncbi:MAG: NFACT family protein [Clostridia bacterium]|nr:NFACT family protein [Clostridia bacterium]